MYLLCVFILSSFLSSIHPSIYTISSIKHVCVNELLSNNYNVTVGYLYILLYTHKICDKRQTEGIPEGEMAMPKQSYTQTAGRLRQREMTSSNAVTSDKRSDKRRQLSTNIMWFNMY